jgi:hypothetical protein
VLRRAWSRSLDGRDPSIVGPGTGHWRAGTRPKEGLEPVEGRDPSIGRPGARRGPAPVPRRAWSRSLEGRDPSIGGPGARRGPGPVPRGLEPVTGGPGPVPRGLEPVTGGPGPVHRRACSRSLEGRAPSDRRAWSPSRAGPHAPEGLEPVEGRAPCPGGPGARRGPGPVPRRAWSRSRAWTRALEGLKPAEGRAPSLVESGAGHGRGRTPAPEDLEPVTGGPGPLPRRAWSRSREGQSFGGTGVGQGRARTRPFDGLESGTRRAWNRAHGGREASSDSGRPRSRIHAAGRRSTPAWVRAPTESSSTRTQNNEAGASCGLRFMASGTAWPQRECIAQACAPAPPGGLRPVSGDMAHFILYMSA